MRNEYAVYMGSERVGTAQVIIEGLFYKIYCLCQLDGTVPCRIRVSGEKEMDLGICVPLENGFGVKTRIPNAGDTWSNVQKVTISLEDAVENVHVGDQPTKWIEDGQVYIQRQGATYDMLGNIIQ